MKSTALVGLFSLFGSLGLTSALTTSCTDGGSTDATGGQGGQGGAPLKEEETGGTGPGQIAEAEAAFCTSDKDCRDSDSLCDDARQVCVDCLADDDCSGDSICKDSSCEQVTTCTSTKDCSVDEVCDTSLEYCVSCVGDNDCANGEACVDSECKTTCSSDKDCRAEDGVCDPTLSVCIACVTAADCQSGEMCTSAGECAPELCSSGAAFCDGDTLQVCNAQGDGFISESCAYGCDEKEAECKAPGENCDEGDLGCSCYPNESCNDDYDCVDGLCETPDTSGAQCNTLAVTFRDFNEIHPDMQAFGGGSDSSACNLVASSLGVDRKPVFGDQSSIELRSIDADGAITCTYDPYYTPPSEITSAETFAHWYNTTAGQNVEVAGSITLNPTGDDFSYANTSFFPLDGKGANEITGGHNYHFTTEIHAAFDYAAGQFIEFSGDDDVWIFVNGKLVMDLGGLHSELRAVVSLDDVSTEIGLIPGENYSLDIFHAERFRVESNFTLTTNIPCLRSTN